jgi:hypothetical protein
MQWLYVKVKVKQSHYRPWQALRVPTDWGSQILRQSTHEGGKVVSPTHRPPLPPGNIPGTHFCYRLSRPQGHSAAGRIMSMKNPMTPSGIDPTTFRFVAQCLNHCVPSCHKAGNVNVWCFSLQEVWQNVHYRFFWNVEESEKFMPHPNLFSCDT